MLNIVSVFATYIYINVSIFATSIRNDMTLQDLKDNRETIIETITNLVGAENVKAFMETMVKGLDCCDSIEELIEGTASIFEYNARPNKETKTAAILGKLAEME